MVAAQHSTDTSISLARTFARLGSAYLAELCFVKSYGCEHPKSQISAVSSQLALVAGSGLMQCIGGN